MRPAASLLLASTLGSRLTLEVDYRAHLAAFPDGTSTRWSISPYWAHRYSNRLDNRAARITDVLRQDNWWMERHPTIRLPARLNLVAVSTILVSSLAALLPGQGNVWLGEELLAIALVYVGLQSYGAVRTSQEVHGLPSRVR